MMKRANLGLFLYLIMLQTVVSAQSDTLQKVVPSRRNSPEAQEKPYVIMISVDGLRWDFLKKYDAKNLIRLSEQGAVAEYMLSSYPSLTFPNHYTLVTGLYPAHHGLVDNSFYDAKMNSVYEMHDQVKVTNGLWYGGTPLWVLAEKQNMLTASFYWVGSDADIQGVRPTYYYSYNEKISTPRRLQIVKEWLSLPAEQRPHLITFYFPEVDKAGHDFGPESKETASAVRSIDQSIDQLVTMTSALDLPINFIIVSDHGMATIDTEKTVAVPAILQDTSACRLVASATMIHVYVKDQKQTKSIFEQLKSEAGDYEVYNSKNVPTRWHYSSADDRFNRLGDILLMTKFPKVFTLGKRKVAPGKHGFDPTTPDMHATFVAWGPLIKQTTLSPFENVNVYPLVARLLRLTPDQPTDGDLKILQGILK